MARGRIEQQIDLRVTGLTEAQQAEQVVDDLDGKRATASVTVEAKGEGEVRSLADRLDGLSKADQRVVLNADVSQAQREVAKVERALRDARSMSADEIRVQLEARDRATARIDEVQQRLRELDAEEAEPEVNVGGNFASVLDKLPGQLGEVASALGPGGAAATGVLGIVTGLAAAATSAADMALSAQTTADLTGTSVEAASRLQAVWQQTGADVNDLNDVMLQMNGVLQTSPELAAQIGVNLNDGRDIAERFVEVVQRVSASTGDAAERAQLMSQLFGEEGVRQVQALVTVIGGDLQGALDDVAATKVVSADDVEQARELKRRMADVTTEFQGAVVSLGEGFLPLLTKAAELAAKVGEGLPGGDRNTILNPLTSENEALQQAEQHWRDRAGVITASYNAEASAALAAEKAARDKAQGMAELRGAELAVAAAGALVAQSATEQENAWRLAIGATGELIANLGAIADAQRAAADAGFGLRDAQRDYAAQLEASKEATEGSKTTLQEWSLQMDLTAQAAGRVADSQVKMDSETAAATGQTYDAADAQRTWNRSMIDSANQAEGPLRDAIITYIAAVNGIPPEVVSDILANPDYPTIEAAQQAIEAAAADQRTSIAVSDNGTAAATADRIDREIPSSKTTSVNVIKGTGWDIFNPGSIRVTATRTGGGQQPAAARTAPVAGRSGVALLDAPADAGEPVEARTDGAYESLPAPTAAAELVVPVSAPSLGPVSVTVQAAVIGNRFDVERAVRRATRDGVRLAGRRDRGVT